MLTSTLYYVAKHPEVKDKVFAEIERFGRARKVTHEDMDKFPYLEVSARLLLVTWHSSTIVLTVCDCPLLQHTGRGLMHHCSE